MKNKERDIEYNKRKQIEETETKKGKRGKNKQ